MGSCTSNSSHVSYDKRFVNLMKCGHSDYKKFTECIYLKRIPLLDTGLDQVIKTGRIVVGIVTAGLTEAGYGIYKGATGAGDGVNHYFLEMDFICSECQKEKKYNCYCPIKTYTIELTDKNKYFVPGYYLNSEIRDTKNGYWSYKEIEDEYNSMRSDYDGGMWNCGHFAKCLFKKL